jgi:hypothetical protein
MFGEITPFPICRVKMGVEFFPETSENHILTSAQEDFFEFCHHESFKTYWRLVYKCFSGI